MGLKCKLAQSSDKLVEPLVRALSCGIDKRFQSILSDKEYLIASVLLPQFKLHFLPEDARLDMKRKVLTYVQQVAEEINVGSGNQQATPTTDAVKEDDDDLYSFMSSVGQQTEVGNPLSTELDDFFGCKSASILSLKDYPHVARAFQKANSTLPSSAAVERLFSFAGMILTPRRCKVSDTLFDKMVFLRCRSRK